VLVAYFPLMSGNSYYVHGQHDRFTPRCVWSGHVVGYTGQVSFGYAGLLFGVGSLHRRCAVHELGAPLWVIIPASIAVTACVRSAAGAASG
jgi:branched-chain amino acid transport system permease protein